MQVEEKCCNLNLKNKIDTQIYDDKDDFPTSLLRSVYDVIKKENYASYNVEKRLISTIGGNYLSILYEVDIRGHKNEEKNGEEKEINIFIKYMIPKEQNILSVSDAYLNERFAYRELFEVFTELQAKANVPLGERFKTIKCYPSGPEAIMLDNLTRHGFTTPYRMDGVSLQFAELAMEQLAKFHGLSFVLQELKPDYYNEKLKKLEQPFKFCEDFDIFYTNMFNLMSSNLSEARKKKLELLLPSFINRLPKYVTDREPVGNVVCHGDFRPNNILMKESVSFNYHIFLTYVYSSPFLFVPILLLLGMESETTSSCTKSKPLDKNIRQINQLAFTISIVKEVQQ